MNRRLNRPALLIGGAALLAALTVGGLLGGLGTSEPEAVEAGWRPPATATPRPSAAPSTPERRTPTRTPTRTPRLTPTRAAAPASPPAAPTATPPPSEELPTLTPPPAEASPPAATPAPPFVVYTVARGDILYGLARRFNTTAEAIRALNPDINPESLRVGQVIRIPAAP